MPDQQAVAASCGELQHQNLPSAADLTQPSRWRAAFARLPLRCSGEGVAVERISLPGIQCLLSVCIMMVFNDHL